MILSLSTTLLTHVWPAYWMFTYRADSISTKQTQMCTHARSHRRTKNEQQIQIVRYTHRTTCTVWIYRRKIPHWIITVYTKKMFIFVKEQIHSNRQTQTHTHTHCEQHEKFYEKSEGKKSSVCRFCTLCVHIHTFWWVYHSYLAIRNALQLAFPFLFWGFCYNR